MEKIHSEANWENAYKSGKHVNTWPWSAVVSYVHRYLLSSVLHPEHRTLSVLEIGCGAGGNIPLFSQIDADYSGIDLSATAVDICRAKFPRYRNNIWNESFADRSWEIEKYDLVLDRASVTHGDSYSVQVAVKGILSALKKGGLYIGIDWFSKKHVNFQSTDSTYVDRNTRRDFQYGPFTGLGMVHFVDEFDLVELFKNFEILEMNENSINRIFPTREERSIVTLNVVARKSL